MLRLGCKQCLPPLVSGVLIKHLRLENEKVAMRIGTLTNSYSALFLTEDEKQCVNNPYALKGYPYCGYPWGSAKYVVPYQKFFATKEGIHALFVEFLYKRM